MTRDVKPCREMLDNCQAVQYSVYRVWAIVKPFKHRPAMKDLSLWRGPDKEA
jgi:hypothetical protein